MPPPSKADTRYSSRKPHPLSLVPLTEVFPEGTPEYTALRRDAQHVPPLAHCRNSSARPLEVRVRSTITSITDIDFAKQTFTCSFFLDASWVRACELFASRKRVGVVSRSAHAWLASSVRTGASALRRGPFPAGPLPAAC